MTKPNLLAISLLVLCQPLYAVGIYKWVDESGKEIYGNQPPSDVKKTEVPLEELTILPKPAVDDDGNTGGVFVKDDSGNNPTESGKNKADESAEPKFEVAYPKDDEAIRSNDGSMTFKFDLLPDLQKGESIVVYLDGKQLESSNSLEVSVKALDRGTHSLFAVKHDAEGRVVANSNNIKFHLLRHSKLF